GLILTYRQSGKTMGAAYDDPVAENYHEWRKQAKYHHYHMTLLCDLWRPVTHSLEKETDDLSDLLGDDHNLDVLHKTLLKSTKKYGKKGHPSAPWVDRPEKRRTEGGGKDNRYKNLC